MQSSFPIDEVIQVQVLIFKRFLKLDRDIVIITDPEYWKEIYVDKGSTEKSYGESVTHEAYVYIDPTHHHFKALSDTILHELIHIKYPNLTEAQVVKKVKEYIN